MQASCLIEITKCPIHVFWKMMIPYSRISAEDRSSSFVDTRLFLQNNVFDVQASENFPKKYVRKRLCLFFESLLQNLVYPESNIIGFGIHGHVQQSETHASYVF